MSRRSFDFEHPKEGCLCVTAGWDRPLQGFFLTLERLHPVLLEPDPFYLFSNLDPETFPEGMHFPQTTLTLENVRQVLGHYRIPAPLNYFLDLLEDARINVGSLEQHYILPERVR